MSAASSRLAWELEVESGHGALFGAHISSLRDLGELVPLLRARGIETLTLDSEASRELVLAFIEGRAQLPEADTIILVDALASLPSDLRRRANRSREAWLASKRCFVFAESAAGSPETLRELCDLLAVFRDIVDLRPDVGLDDYMWDTRGAASLEHLARHIFATTRGPTLIVNGRVHHKRRPVVCCPECGGALEATTVELRFEHAPDETAVQVVDGWRCLCGAQWPEPRAMRAAHARAFAL